MSQQPDNFERYLNKVFLVYFAFNVFNSFLKLKEAIYNSPSDGQISRTIIAIECVIFSFFALGIGIYVAYKLRISARS